MCRGDGSCCHSLSAGLLRHAAVSSRRAFVPPDGVAASQCPEPPCALVQRKTALPSCTAPAAISGCWHRRQSCSNCVPAAELRQADPSRAPLHPILEPPVAPLFPSAVARAVPGLAGLSQLTLGALVMPALAACLGLLRLLHVCSRSRLQGNLPRCGNFFPCPKAPA